MEDTFIDDLGVTHHISDFAPDDNEPKLQDGECVCGAFNCPDEYSCHTSGYQYGLIRTVDLYGCWMYNDYLLDGTMRTDRIHSLKNLSKLGEADMEAIRQRMIDIENLDDDANWTESGLNELSFYDIDLYRDVPGGAVHFIGGAMATLHRVNGPHLI